MKKISYVIPVILMSSLMSGCAFDPSLFKAEPEVKIVTVEKPVLFCPVPPSFAYPRLIIEDLVPGDEKDPGRVVQYYKATVKQLEGEIVTRDIILNAYGNLQQADPTLTPVEVEAVFNKMIEQGKKDNEATTPVK